MNYNAPYTKLQCIVCKNYNTYYTKLQANYVCIAQHKITIALHYTTLNYVSSFDSYCTQKIYCKLWLLGACAYIFLEKHFVKITLRVLVKRMRL